MMNCAKLSQDDTKAIKAAMTDGKRCGVKCNGSTTKNAIVYFPPGTYRISSTIPMPFGTQVIGDVRHGGGCRVACLTNNLGRPTVRRLSWRPKISSAWVCCRPTNTRVGALALMGWISVRHQPLFFRGKVLAPAEAAASTDTDKTKNRILCQHSKLLPADPQHQDRHHADAPHTGRRRAALPGRAGHQPAECRDHRDVRHHAAGHLCRERQRRHHLGRDLPRWQVWHLRRKPAVHSPAAHLCGL